MSPAREPTSVAGSLGALAGTGPIVTPPAGQTSTYDVRLPIQTGDALGLDCCDDSEAWFIFLQPPDQTSLAMWEFPPLADGGPIRSGQDFQQVELLINADIEADGDHDATGWPKYGEAPV